MVYRYQYDEKKVKKNAFVSKQETNALFKFNSNKYYLFTNSKTASAINFNCSSVNSV